MQQNDVQLDRVLLMVQPPGKWLWSGASDNFVAILVVSGGHAGLWVW